MRLELESFRYLSFLIKYLKLYFTSKIILNNKERHGYKISRVQMFHLIKIVLEKPLSNNFRDFIVQIYFTILFFSIHPEKWVGITLYFVVGWTHKQVRHFIFWLFRLFLVILAFFYFIGFWKGYILTLFVQIKQKFIIHS